MNNTILYDNIKYELINFNTGSCGRFYIYINKEKTHLYKYARVTKIKTEMKNDNHFNNYKQIIEQAEQKEIVGKYLINGKIIKQNCGDYIIRYIDGYRFDHLYRINDIELLNKIKIQIDIFIEDLKLANSKKLLHGDWGIQNIIYDKENGKIYNIDIEGLYTYPRLPSWCNINKIIEDIYESYYSNPLIKTFTAIIWNNGLQNKNDIIEMIPNVITYKPFNIKKTDLHKSIFDIYSMDKRCNHNVVLPRKIENLKKYNEDHLILQFLIDEPKFNNRNISSEAVNMKNNIRKKFGNIIHVADNYEESNYLWSNYNPSCLFDVYIKKFSDKTKIISKDKLDDSDDNEVSVISVFNGDFKHSNPLIKYSCYKKSDNNYYFSDNNSDNKDIFCFSFYCTKYMVDKYLR